MSAEISLPDADQENGSETAAVTPSPAPVPLFERTLPLFLLFLVVGAVALIGTWLTVHSRPATELAATNGSVRSHVVLTHWLNEGYFHYSGLLVRHPTEPEIYKSSTGGYMVSAFILEKVYSAASGRYSWRLVALHNQIVSLILSALAGLLAFRISRTLGLDAWLAFASGAAVVIVLFTFPDNLQLYWEMSAQVPFLAFALCFALIEERTIDQPRTRLKTILQALAAFLMCYMEVVAGLAFIFALAGSILVLQRGNRAAWKHYVLVALLPVLAALALYRVQLAVASIRFEGKQTSGSELLFRTGLDGDSKYYGDHLGIAFRRDVARGNWAVNREHMFRWKWVFILGVMSVLGVLVAYIRGLVPRFVVETLTSLTGAWLLYAAVFSQSFVIHPYLYDVMLFTPLVIALFAIAPAVVETITGRTGAIFLVVIFCAIWYALFQARLYALRYPLPKPRPAAAAPANTAVPA